MRCFLTIVFLTLATIAVASDSTDVVLFPISDVPVREVLDDGTPIPPEQIDKIHQKDCSPWGWMYNWGEWDLLFDGIPVVPEYYYDESRQESNGGYSIG